MTALKIVIGVFIGLNLISVYALCKTASRCDRIEESEKNIN